MFPDSDGSMFVRSNNISKPVIASDIFRAWKSPREASSICTGDVVGVQSIASSSSSRDCSCDVRTDAGAGVDDARGDGELNVAGLSEG